MKSPESQKNTNNIKRPRNKNHGRFLRLNIGKERNYLFDDLAMMLKSGVSAQAALSLVRDNAKQKLYRKVISHVLAAVDEGIPLWQALENTGVFNDYSISLIRIGEESGRLAENLELIAKHEEKQRNLNSKIVSAISYPAFVFGLTILVGIGALVFIFPRLSSVFSSLNVKLPAITRAMIYTGNTMQKHGLIIMVLALTVIVCGIYFLFMNKRTRKLGDKILLIIPGISKLIKQIEVERLGFLVGTLLEAGVPINKAFISLKRATRNYAYQNMYAAVAANIENGVSLEKSLQEVSHINKLIPRPVLEMIATGERSGSLPVVLQEIGSRYEKKTDTSAENLGQLLEPVLLVLVWLGVLGIALSVIVPVYGLIGGLNQNIQQTNTPATTTLNSGSTSTIEIFAAQPGAVKVYVKPDTSSQVITTVKTGETFKVQSKQTNWYEILLVDGRSAWIPVTNFKLRN